MMLSSRVRERAARGRLRRVGAAVWLMRCSFIWLLAVGAGEGVEDEKLRAEMISEASSRVAQNRTGNGKFFLSTGAWFLTDEYVSEAARKGCPECVYRLDEKLAGCLAKLFADATVTELGAGVGRYKKYIEAQPAGVRAYTAYDGMPDAEKKSNGRVLHADLATTDNAIVTSDWCLTLEVAEHIPPQYERNFLANIDKANRKGVVISWSQWGQGKSSHGHVNPKPPGKLLELFKSRGYAVESNATHTLRKCAVFPYHKRLWVFSRAAAG